MNPPSPDPSAITLRETAARWTVRRDRGLSAAESIEFELWLASDPRHAAAMQHAAAAWSLLDRLPDNVAAPVLAASTRRRSFWRRSLVLGSLAAAAALALFAFRAGRSPLPPTAPAALASAPTTGPRQLTLGDGTIVQLNTGGEIVEQFTAAERRVLLTHGEAHFAVTKNPARPFVVQAGALRVRAVGTAFNVHLQSSQIEVLVTEGRVQLATGPASSSVAAPASAPSTETPLVEAGQRAVWPTPSTAGPPPDIVVSRIDAEEMARALAWQAPLLRLGGATLGELVVAFELRSGRRVILADPALAQMRVGGRFRADDADGFANLLAATLDLDVERLAEGTLVLRKKKPESR